MRLGHNDTYRGGGNKNRDKPPYVCAYFPNGSDLGVLLFDNLGHSTRPSNSHLGHLVSSGREIPGWRRSPGVPRFEVFRVQAGPDCCLLVQKHTGMRQLCRYAHGNHLQQ